MNDTGNRSRPQRSEPIASARLQLTPDFGFDAAIDVLDTIAALGVSHVYLSPVTQAIPDSGHGYDVVDHTRVRAEFGGDAGLDRLLDASHDRGLGVLVDHVPNHVSVARAELNEPWWTMLRDGPTCGAARWFDVEWAAADDKVIVPKLGAPLDDVLADGGIEIGDGDRGPELRYGPLRFPLTPGTEDVDVDEAVRRQHYELAFWRDPRRNVRRFFTIDDLVAVRVEHDDVVAQVDTLPRRLASHAAFAGVRVDHVDGLAEPGAYLEQLRELIGDDRLLLVEKILAPGERLPESWPVDGTTGYEHVVATEHTLLDPSAEAVLRTEWERSESSDRGVGSRTFDELALEARVEVLDDGLRPDLDRLLRAIDAAAHDAEAAGDLHPRAGSADARRQAVIALTTALDRYRTYLPSDPASTGVFDDVVERTRDALNGGRAETRAELEHVADVIRHDPTALARWQQLSGPAMAKGVEDRVFYRWFPLASLCEVGGEPDVFATSVDAFHDEQRRRQADSPTGMLAETTHDTKRSAGVRARSIALAAHAEDWQRVSSAWRAEHRELCDGIDGGLVTLALQTAVTARPLTSERLEAYLVKAAREGDLITSWTAPDDEAERGLARLAGQLADALAEGSSHAEHRDGDDGSDTLVTFAQRIEHDAAIIGLRMLALHLTCPGFPDLYQGSPRSLLSLVDPDNRRPPDWEALGELVARNRTTDVATALLADEEDLARSILVERVLHLRRRRPAAFGRTGGYAELTVHGDGSHHVIAFARTAPDESSSSSSDGSEGAVSVTIVPRALATPIDGTAVTVSLPDGTWRSLTQDDARLAEGSTSLADLVDGSGIALLERIS